MHQSDTKGNITLSIGAHQDHLPDSNLLPVHPTP